LSLLICYSQIISNCIKYFIRHIWWACHDVPFLAGY